MSDATSGTCPLLERHQDDWHLLYTGHQNVLIEGAVASTTAVVSLLLPHLREPIARRHPATPLDLPDNESGTLMLEDAATLSPAEQKRLLAWIHGAGSLARIVATARHPLFTNVERGLFDAALYYRLNVMLLQLDAADGALHAHGDIDSVSRAPCDIARNQPAVQAPITNGG